MTTATLGLLPHSVVRPREGVLARELGGEMVVLDVEGGIYYGLNEVATRAWTLWLEGSTFGETLERLQSDYKVEVEVLRSDLTDLVRDLLDHGLIDVAPA